MENIKFEDFNLHKEILNSLKKLGYNNPLDVQRNVIPFILNKRDIIVKSKTGSGKTAAFGIPICNEINVEENKAQALILTPTRELAIQIKNEISNIGRLKKIRCEAVFGKESINEQSQKLKQRVHIIVGTPGRVNDHIERKSLDLSNIKYFVIDEADEMLNMGFIDQVQSIIKSLPDKKEVMLFSATINDNIKKLCINLMINPEYIEIKTKNNIENNINEEYYFVEESEKINILNKLLYMENPKKCIIFCNTREETEYVENKMKKRGYYCSKLHGGMEQKERIKIMNEFKNGHINFLISTDVLARGIHVDNLSYVINYNIPFEKESYVHRIGRTGRNGKSGIAISLLTQKEISLFNTIKDYTKRDILKKEIPKDLVFNNNLKINLKTKPKVNLNNKSKFGNEVTKLYIGAGKKKKIRFGDIVGALINIDGIEFDDIGVIDIKDGFSYVDILNGKGNVIINKFSTIMIKGKKVRIQKASK